MQFVSNGPEIPERLLQLHEEGRVVFFCGAGISYPAKLPGFKQLVDDLYAALSVTKTPVQSAALDTCQFDTAVNLLELAVVGGRSAVRTAMVPILTPKDLSTPASTATHKALLALSQNRRGQYRLITTNFDRIFEHVIKENGLSIPTHLAPYLPLPNNQWDGLTYLHGRLPESSSPEDLDRLVISSGDFGRAYLTQRWASRFVSELFRKFSVCFVGYSIGDPVLRYMLDALAADRLQGEEHPEMFVFGSFSKGEKDKQANEWKAKNVTPILYLENHELLHKTLWAWADTYRDGTRGKERIVVESVLGRPVGSTEQDDFIGRTLWALGDRHGLAAKQFADLNPVPSLDWLGPISTANFCHADLSRFGVPPLTTEDDRLSFSLLARPAPYTLTPWMTVANHGGLHAKWDPVMYHLARWLLRHLDDPELPLWLAEAGGRLDPVFTRMLDERLIELAKLEREGKADEIERIREDAPNAIPRPSMRKLWRLFLAGRIKADDRNHAIFDWFNRFESEGLTIGMRESLRDALTPVVVLSRPSRLDLEDVEPCDAEQIRPFVNWALELASDNAYSRIFEVQTSPHWNAALPALLDIFTALLREALDLRSAMGSADELSDLTYVHQPSISKHDQNNHFEDWTTLIELVRDAWLATAEHDQERARNVVDSWLFAPYPIFRRLALFAATYVHIVAPKTGLKILLEAQNWWLWSVETQRETMRWLVGVASHLDAAERMSLEAAILAGPPNKMFPDGSDPDDLASIFEQGVWLRLSKIIQGGGTLGDTASSVLDSIRTKHPEWQSLPDEIEEFPFWTGSSAIEFGLTENALPALPQDREGLLSHCEAHPELDSKEAEAWKQHCLKHLELVAVVIRDLAQKDKWPVSRWRCALSAWSEGQNGPKAWEHLRDIVSSAPDDFVDTLARELGWWLKSIANTFEGNEESFLGLIDRLYRLDYEPIHDETDAAFVAINHPVGLVTQAALTWWYRRKLEDGQLLPEVLNTFFTSLCDPAFEKFKHGRVILASNVISLFRVDPTWAQTHLLPLFDWEQRPEEAQRMWIGFLWSPRLYRPLMELLKPSFLATAGHYERLGRYKNQYPAILTFAALDRGDTFSAQDLAGAIRVLPSNGLREIVSTLVRAQESSGENREAHWKNRVLPFWTKLWPQTVDYKLTQISAPLARLAIAAGNEFPSAVEVLSRWIQPVDHPNYVLRKLRESELCARFPDSALALLSGVLGIGEAWLLSDMRACLDAIERAAPTLAQDQRFRRLDELARARSA